MSIDPRQALITQFSQFMTGKISNDEWKTIVRTFGAGDIAKDTTRFYRSKFFNDGDEARRTIEFLEKVHEVDNEIAFAIMGRAYEVADGATVEELNKYPALENLESGDVSSGSLSFSTLSNGSNLFVDIGDIPGNFYPGLVEQINQCYRFGLYDASLVLSRKLLENLLIDILRSEFGTDRIGMYYDVNNKRFLPFYKLVSNLSYNLDRFEHYSSAMDQDFINKLDTFRQTANRGAHSLEMNLTSNDIKEYGEKVEYLSKVLFRIYDSV